MRSLVFVVLIGMGLPGCTATYLIVHVAVGEAKTIRSPDSDRKLRETLGQRVEVQRRGGPTVRGRVWQVWPRELVVEREDLTHVAIPRRSIEKIRVFY